MESLYKHNEPYELFHCVYKVKSLKVGMIRILIEVDKDQIKTIFNKKQIHTLIENSMAVRALEEIKSELVDLQFETDLLIEEDYDEEDTT